MQCFIIQRMSRHFPTLHLTNEFAHTIIILTYLSESDQNILRHPLTVILMRSLSKKRAWLRVADTRSSIYRREHDDMMRSVPTLEAFFDTINPPLP